MGQRSRVIVGSIVGAVAVHLAMLACSGDGGSPPGQLDASAVDGGHQARADAGDILDAITAGDLGGALDAVADVVRDAVGKAVDAETRDAHAGGDGGAPGPRFNEGTCVESAVSAGVRYYAAEVRVPGYNGNTSGPLNVLLCGLTCTNTACVIATPGAVVAQRDFECRSAPSYFTRGDRVLVYCGGEGDRGMRVRVFGP